MHSETMVSERYPSEFSDEVKTIIHVISVGENSRGGWYRQIGAKEGLCERTLYRWNDYWHTKKRHSHISRVRFSRFWNDDIEIYNSSRERLLKLLPIEDVNKHTPELVYMNHDSVWDFFDHIGYNHKDKRVSNIDKFIWIKELE